MLKSFKGLTYRLNCSIDELDKIVNNIDSYYYSFEKKQEKPDGTVKTRIIEPSKGELKKVQELINKNILSKIPLLPNIQGGVKNKSNITNAKLHLGKKYHFCTDIKKFFPSIRHYQVYDMFIENMFAPKIANILTKLTTYKGKLPQGNPTSTSIANLVFQKIDKEIISICESYEITYSRYVDDLVFSSPKCFKDKQESILNIINKHKFNISHSKTYYKAGPVEVTGIVVKHNNLDVTDFFKDKIKNENNPQKKVGLDQYKNRVLQK